MMYLKHEDVPVGFGYVEDTVRGRLANWMNEKNYNLSPIIYLLLCLVAIMGE